MGKEAKFFVNESFAVPPEITEDGGETWRSKVNSKLLARAALVGGAPELASNNISVPSILNFGSWVDQMAVGVITPSGKTPAEVKLTQKIGMLFRTPIKWFTELSLALENDDLIARATAKWKRNFGLFGDVALQAVGVNALLPGIPQAALRFLDSDQRFRRVAGAQTEITEDDGITCLRKEISRQASSLIGIFTYALTTVNKAFRAGVNGAEITAFITAQETRMLNAISGFEDTPNGKDVTIATVITTPRKGIHVKCVDVTT